MLALPRPGRGQGSGEDRALGGQRLGVTAPPGLGEADVDAPPVQVAQRALHQAVLLEPADQPGQRALAQVHVLGQFLHPELVLLVLGQALQHLELGDAQPVPLAELPFQGRVHGGMPRGERAPGAHDLGDALRRGRIRPPSRGRARIPRPGQTRSCGRGRALVNEVGAALLLGHRRSVAGREGSCKCIYCGCNYCLHMHIVSAMDSATTLAGAGRRWSPRLWGLLVVLCGALFLDALDVSMVGVALPSIRADLGLSTASLQWVVSGYVLGYGGLLLLGGRAADLLGRRRVFLAALAVFAVASLLGGLVSSGPLLIAARLVKGMAAAFTAPAGLSIITTTFAEGPARNRALAIYSAFGAAGFSLGLVLSGLLTEISWRWTLLLPAPVAAVVLAAGMRLIPRADSPVTVGSRAHTRHGAAPPARRGF